MKQFIRLITITSMVLLCACGKGNTAETEEPAAVSSDAVTETQSEVSEGPKVVTSSFGKGEGVMGDTMKPSFMEFTLNSAYLTSAYQTLTPDEGMKLLVLNITTHVTQSHEMTLYDTDYQVQWGGTGEEDYSVPVTYRDEWATAPTYKRYVNLDGITDMFEGTAVLASDETMTTNYVYQVPVGFNNFTLQFQEYFEDESVGDRFIVTFQAEEQG